VTTTDQAIPVSTVSSWLRRARLIVAVLILWLGLHYVARGVGLGAGLDRPVTLLTSPRGILGTLAIAIVLWVWAYAGTLLAGAKRSPALLVASLGLGLWAATFGGMDDWLILNNPVPSAAIDSGRAAYLALIPDYIALAVIVAGSALIGAHANLGRAIADPGERARGLSRFIPTAALRRDGYNGFLALAVTCVVAAILLNILSGPRSMPTRRGQVYFAVFVALWGGVFAARQFVKVRQTIWFFPAPFIVGLVGLIWAAKHTQLPAPYQQLNIIPALGFARPLPIEMVAVGLLAILWTLRTAAQPPATSAAK
jgi:hypothetical protein